MKEVILLPNKGLKASQANQKQYQGMTGSLMFSMMETRPDIAFATLVVCQFAKNPSRQHTEAVKNIMHDLKATKTMGITYGSSKGSGDVIIKGYSDAD